jgi:uncharacterized protein with GYD domain
VPLYTTQFAYTPETRAVLTRSPKDRSEAVRGLLESMGGRMVSYYNNFGEYDGVIIFEAPDEGTAAGVLAAASTGHLKATKTTSLLSVEDAMEEMRKAGEATLRWPGQQ